jgi:hypothetical protein
MGGVNNLADKIRQWKIGGKKLRSVWCRLITIIFSTFIIKQEIFFFDRFWWMPAAEGSPAVVGVAELAGKRWTKIGWTHFYFLLSSHFESKYWNKGKHWLKRFLSLHLFNFHPQTFKFHTQQQQTQNVTNFIRKLI